MAQFILRDVQYALGYPPLVDHVNMTVEIGEKIALIGRNGAGKSTLLKLLNQDLTPDDGEITRAQGLQTMLLTQQVPVELTGKVFDIIAAGQKKDAELLSRFHEVTAGIARAYEVGEYERAESLQKELDRLQHELDISGAWESQRKVESVLQKIGISGDEEISTLSAGKKRRVLFGRAVVAEPDVLLLDEPTNHLDLESILWLEDFLKKYEKTVIFVTHDRMFLRKIADSIWELDRGHLFRYDCDYDTYLDRREQRLHAEEKELEHFQKKLAQEEVWIRTGIMARRTRNEGRVRALKQMRRDAALIRKDPGVAKIQIQEGVTSGRLVVETKGLTFAFSGENEAGETRKMPIVEDLSVKIMRGDRIGILGPNGVGKTTLLRLLLGQLTPDAGDIRLGTQLQISYFDQLHATLNEEESVLDNVSDGSTHVTVNGTKQHVLGYLRDFLFSEERSKMAVKFLSGGEKNRLLLAKLFTKPSNILVMDEPTNDLDMETLDLLEEKLSQYPGTLLLVSHDREFVNNVVTSTLVFEGNGRVKEYVGGYDDWYEQSRQEEQAEAARLARQQEKNNAKSDGKSTEKSAQKSVSKPTGKPASKLTYKEKLELEKLPIQIEELENQMEELNTRLAEPGYYQRDEADFLKTTREAEQIQRELEKLYARWDDLEEQTE
ncbi:MAG: ATP-binding cassette domain-containing protein [Planctomycetia bacterium]|nr:ATP-binding cassette domain-containing protein [Planctomycetia bacterium]